MHHLRTEAVLQRTDANDWIGPGAIRAHQSISMKNNAARASSTITEAMLCTTLEVVRSPTDCAVPSTLNPSRQPISDITTANSGALPRPIRKWRTATVSWNRVRKAQSEERSVGKECVRTGRLGWS